MVSADQASGAIGPRCGAMLPLSSGTFRLSLRSTLIDIRRAPWKGAFLWRVRTPPNTCRSGW